MSPDAEVASTVTRRGSSRLTPGVGGSGSHSSVTRVCPSSPLSLPIQVRM